MQVKVKRGCDCLSSWAIDFSGTRSPCVMALFFICENNVAKSARTSIEFLFPVTPDMLNAYLSMFKGALNFHDNVECV